MSAGVFEWLIASIFLLPPSVNLIISVAKSTIIIIRVVVVVPSIFHSAPPHASFHWEKPMRRNKNKRGEQQKTLKLEVYHLIQMISKNSSPQRRIDRKIFSLESRVKGNFVSLCRIMLFINHPRCRAALAPDSSPIKQFSNAKTSG